MEEEPGGRTVGSEVRVEGGREIDLAHRLLVPILRRGA